MFEQNVTHGPGIGTFTSHTFEIITMLLGAFLLGLWLGWMLWSKYKSMIDKYRLDNESLNATLEGLKAENETLQAYKLKTEDEQIILHDKISALATENNLLKFSYEETQNKLEEVSSENMSLEGLLSMVNSVSPESAKVPMEIVTSPFDVHVEDLVPVTDKEEEATEASLDLEVVQPQVEEHHHDEAVFIHTEEPVYVEEDHHGEATFTPIEEPLHLEEEQHHEETVVLVPADEPEEELMSTPLEVEPTVEEHDFQQVLETDHVESEALPIFEVVQAPEEVAEAENFTANQELPKITLTDDELDAPLPNIIVEPTSASSRVVIAPAVLSLHPESESETSTTKEVVLDMEHDSSEPMVVAPVFDIPDDLKVVEGIGPKIEEILHKHNIVTFAHLASTPVNRIKEILISEGSRYAMHDPGTWPAQALLASNNEWDNLKAYQLFLNAGKRPT